MKRAAQSAHVYEGDLKLMADVTMSLLVNEVNALAGEYKANPSNARAHQKRAVRLRRFALQLAKVLRGQLEVAALRGLNRLGE